VDNVKQRSVDELIEYATNPREISAEAVEKMAAMIHEFGFRVPVIARNDGLIVDGHLRLMAARKLGLETVPCLSADDMTDQQIRAFRIAVNKAAELASWDDELLASELLHLKDDDCALDVMGFGDDDIEELLADIDTDEEKVAVGLTDDDEVPEPKADIVSKLGDVWLLDGHRVMCGDSTSIEEVGKLMNGGVADMLLTDPPYNVAYKGKTAESLTIDNNCSMKNGAVFYIWHADSEGFNFRGACRDVGWKVRECLIWVKSSLVLGRQDYHWKHEPCLYGWKDGAAHLWMSDRCQTTVMEFDKPSRNGVHPTMKPVELFEYQMMNNTKQCDVVLDLFGGSGTTLIAAEKNNRKAMLMELDPSYCDVIVRRWQDFTGKTATNEATGEAFGGEV